MTSSRPPGLRALFAILGWLIIMALTPVIAAPAQASAHHHPHPPTAVVNAVDFVDARHGWIAGDHGAIMATSNAGLTWMFQHGTGASVTSLDFVDRTHGWAISGSRILSTVDGGLQWRARKAPGSGLSSVQFVDPLNGWGIGTRHSDSGGPALLYASTDGGRTWRVTSRQVDAVCRVDVAIDPDGSRRIVRWSACADD